MADQDLPIPDLTPATLPLSGAEIIPASQNGQTVGIRVDSLPQTGGQLNANELAAVENANAPTALNPFVTLNDIPSNNLPAAIQYNTYEKGASDIEAVMPWYIVQGAAPTVNDDVNKGFRAGTMWQDSVTGIEYKNISNAGGAAVWQAQSGEYTPTITPGNGSATINGNVLYYKNGNLVTVHGLLIANSTVGGLFNCNVNLPIDPNNDFAIGNEIVGALTQNNQNILNTLVNKRIIANTSAKLVIINIRDLAQFSNLEFEFNFTYKINN